jgi:hypothetical protein
MEDKGGFETRPYILPPFYCSSLFKGRLCRGIVVLLSFIVLFLARGFTGN